MAGIECSSNIRPYSLVIVAVRLLCASARDLVSARVDGSFAMGQMTRFAKLAEDAKSRIREVSPAEARKLQAGGAVLIDVRESDEFANGHAQDAVHLSRGVLELRIERLVPDLASPILCYCGGGSRSALAADSLQKMGYTNVASVAGGFKAWKELALPTA
jgi:rhodanese-related sulfurtransferase